jgi:hypothetical protein
MSRLTAGNRRISPVQPSPRLPAAPWTSSQQLRAKTLPSRVRTLSTRVPDYLGKAPQTGNIHRQRDSIFLPIIFLPNLGLPTNLEGECWQKHRFQFPNRISRDRSSCHASYVRLPEYNWAALRRGGFPSLRTLPNSCQPNAGKDAFHCVPNISAAGNGLAEWEISGRLPDLGIGGSHQTSRGRTDRAGGMRRRTTDLSLQTGKSARAACPCVHRRLPL